MAMRLFTAEEFDNELHRRGCVFVETHDFGQEWRTPNGLTFLVPHPEEDGDRYPDWMLDDLIDSLDLPPAARDN